MPGRRLAAPSDNAETAILPSVRVPVLSKHSTFNRPNASMVRGLRTSARRPASYLDAIVTTSPSPRFSETTEFGGTYVAGLAGPFGNLRLKWRNPFGGAQSRTSRRLISVSGCTLSKTSVRKGSAQVFA